jgi:hypothetical protein
MGLSGRCRSVETLWRRCTPMCAVWAVGLGALAWDMTLVWVCAVASLRLGERSHQRVCVGRVGDGGGVCVPFPDRGSPAP